MNIKYLNILDNTFNTSLIGGAYKTGGSSNISGLTNISGLSNIITSNKDNYILLSCPEFNETVNSIIELDAKSNIIKSTEDDLKSKCITNDDYEQFLEDIGHNLDDILEKEKKELMQNVASANPSQPKLQKSTSNNINTLKKDLKNQELYARSKSNIETEHFYRGFINWEKYGDKTPDIKMNKETVKRLKDGKVIYFAYFSFNELDSTSMIDQLLLLNSLSHYGVAEIHIVLPYFPVGTMERIVGEGEIPTGYALAQMINSIPSGSSKNKIYIFDIHALCSRFFFHTNTIPVLITLMPKYLEYITTKFPENSTETVMNIGSSNIGQSSTSNIKNLNIIVFPDDGAKKRFAKLLNKSTKTITCSKVRDGNERKIKIDEGIEHLLELDEYNQPTDILKKNTNINLFIIDDLVQSGGTLIKTVEQVLSYLKSKYKKQEDTQLKFYTLVTHSILPIKNKQDKIDLFENQNIEQLITSNSRPLKIKEILKELNTLKKEDKIYIIDIAYILYIIFINHPEKSKYTAPYSII